VVGSDKKPQMNTGARRKGIIGVYPRSSVVSISCLFVFIRGCFLQNDAH